MGIMDPPPLPYPTDIFLLVPRRWHNFNAWAWCLRDHGCASVAVCSRQAGTVCFSLRQQLSGHEIANGWHPGAVGLVVVVGVGAWLRAMSEWVGGWVCALEGTPDSPLVAQQWQTAAGGDRMSGEVWARETHKSFISSGLRFPPLWKSVGVCGRTWPPYQQQDVLVFCFPCTWVLTRVCKHKLNSAMPQ